MSTPAASAIRIDKLLWFLRFAKSRGVAQQIVVAGHIRRNGARVERTAQNVAPGDVLVLPLGTGVRVIELLSLPARRGPASEAQSHYRVLGGEAAAKPHQTLDETAVSLLAASPKLAASQEDLRP